MWLAEDRDGACSSSSVIQVIVSSVGPLEVVTSAAKYREWQELKGGLSSLAVKTPLELRHVDGEWYCPGDSSGVAWTMLTPRFDAKKAELWNEEVEHHMNGAREWNRRYGWDGLDAPRFRGRKFLYYYEYPAGLYVNYDVTEAYYFPTSGYLLILTHQPVLAPNGDTMHGFMVLREFRPALPYHDTTLPGDLDRARKALVTFFSLLHDGHYLEAMNYYGGSYSALRDWNPLIDKWDYVALWESGCTVNGLQCLLVKRIVEQEEISPTTFKFRVEFMNERGGLFVRGPCCDATEEQQPPQSQFDFTVIRLGEQFLVKDLPVYVP
ncbi:MAG: hypothetical protein V2A71_04735 [Candidatus Eisenbacteria bacterium]